MSKFPLTRPLVAGLWSPTPDDFCGDPLARTHLTLLIALLFALAGCASYQTSSEPIGGDAAGEIVLALNVIAKAEAPAQRIAADVAFLADDARGGREAGTAGYDAAANYVAARFQSIGLEPAGEAGGWFQPVTLRQASRDLARAELILTADDGDEHALVHLDDFFIGQSLSEPTFETSGPAVFVGDGVVAPELDRDAYAGVDVRGKIAVMFTDPPSGLDSEAATYFRGRSHRLAAAAENGAVGVVFLRSPADQARWSWRRLVANPSDHAMTWIHADGASGDGARGIRATSTLSEAGAAALFKGAEHEFDALKRMMETKAVTAPSFPIGKTITLRGGSIFEETTSANVAGILRGGDPDVAQDVVVLTAHLDHQGAGIPGADGEDRIHNGALDNAMGVATMLEVAADLAAGSRPRRSVLFLAVTAEEKGLLGSDYYAHYPTVGRDAVIANINLDMPLALFEFEDVIAFGGERSSLGDVVDAAAEAMGIKVIPDPIPEQGIFTRSDHYSFVKQGVPSVFLFLGFGNGGDEVFSEFMREHYHEPSDDLSLPIDYDAASRFAALNLSVTRRVANAADAPVWREGDFFGERFGRDRSPR